MEDQDNMVDMVNDLEEHFVHHPDLCETMMNDAKTPIYEGFTNFTKLSALVGL